MLDDNEISGIMFPLKVTTHEIVNKLLLTEEDGVKP